MYSKLEVAVYVVVLLLCLLLAVMLVLMCGHMYLALKKGLKGAVVEAGSAHVLAKDVVVGTLDPDSGEETHCVMPQGDVIRIDEVELMASGRAVMISYGRTSPRTLNERPRCQAGMQVRFDEDAVLAMIQ